MSTQNDSTSLFKKYIDEYGTAPTRPEYFITFCKKHGVKLRYKDCREIIENPPIKPKLIKTPSNSVSDSDPYNNNEQDELKYSIDHEHNTHRHSHHDTHSSQHSHRTHSSKSITITPTIKQIHFTKLSTRERERTISESMTFSLNITNNNTYISPEILINQIIPITDNNSSNINIISYRKDSNVQTYKHQYRYLIRDFLFSIFYWLLVINGFFDFYDFGLWYFRFICFFLWHCILIISLLAHYRFNSPPYYPVYHGSDSKYKPYFNKSAVEYIKHISSLSPKVMLFHIQTFGPLSESTCDTKSIIYKKLEDKSMDIINEISKHKNKLIRLRVYHIIKFYNSESYDKFKDILKDTKSENKRAEQMFHIEYNVEFKQRLLMNTTVDMNHKKNFWNWWNYSCSNRRASYFWYLMGFGFCYRSYHDFSVKTLVYDCVKEVTL